MFAFIPPLKGVGIPAHQRAKGVKIAVITGGITAQEVDAIVNPPQTA